MDKRELLEQRSQHRREIRRKRAMRNRAILVGGIIVFLAILFLIVNTFINANQGSNQVLNQNNEQNIASQNEENNSNEPAVISLIDDPIDQADSTESDDTEQTDEDATEEGAAEEVDAQEDSQDQDSPEWAKGLQDYGDYKSSSIMVFNPSDGQEVVSINPEEKVLPGALTKLFLVEYTLDKLEMNDVVVGRNSALYMQDQESPVAYFTAGEYRVRDAIKGLILKVGDDAGYMILDNIGAKIDSNADTSVKRIDAAMEDFNNFLDQKGYTDTNIVSINTTDTESTTSSKDVAKVLSVLLANSDVSKDLSTHVLEVTNGNGDRLTMVNRNSMINPSDQIHRENITGGIYGSSLGVNNLASVYEKDGQRYIIVTLDSQSRGSLYDDTAHIADYLDEQLN